jgi:hypothetical protein
MSLFRRDLHLWNMSLFRWDLHLWNMSLSDESWIFETCPFQTIPARLKYGLLQMRPASWKHGPFKWELLLGDTAFFRWDLHLWNTVPFKWNLRPWNTPPSIETQILETQPPSNQTCIFETRPASNETRALETRPLQLRPRSWTHGLLQMRPTSWKHDLLRVPPVISLSTQGHKVAWFRYNIHPLKRIYGVRNIQMEEEFDKERKNIRKESIKDWWRLSFCPGSVWPRNWYCWCVFEFLCRPPFVNRLFLSAHI